MAKTNLIHDSIGKTLMIHFSDPKEEYSSERAQHVYTERSRKREEEIDVFAVNFYMS